ncbi:sulfotransferase family cytosolic 1B member 1-like [Patiria miniata]|uniref:Sulfotransferase domain-containing protein n=1 Tax=Patiria miniata TaxID=46514 RepID=A0A913ZA03_PATMI|nr:sulfotransferase family cytosolic 1B member 1-like [Patiria miniata]XP_038047819.1 sulfotransferase family cytosolic 1B member 1-like [Patiria miniata]XP_038047831.1 sulfotransferase family cytosolic 1B member 1-like [Patiria miniata]
MAANPLLSLLPATINGKTHTELLQEIQEFNALRGVHELDGNHYAWLMPRDNFDALKTFQVRDDDIYMVTFPKSGTHWLGEIIDYVMSEGRDDFDRTNMSAVLEITMEADPSKFASATPGYKILETMASPRIMGTHCLPNLLPPQVMDKKPKMFYLARNPKDLMVSYFIFIKPFLTPTLQTWEGFLFMLVAGQMVGGSWFDHVLSYWERRNDDNLLFLKYEDLHKDLKGNIRKVAAHLGKNLSDDVIDKIAERVTLAGMQKTYKNIEEAHGEKGKKMTHLFGMAPYLRKGKVGGWKEVFTAEQSALFDMIYAEKMKGSGLDFDFEL